MVLGVKRILSVGPDLELAEKSEATTKVVSTNKKEESVAQDQEDKGMQENMDREVDVSECINYREFEIIDVECQDTTECSSSFGDTVSGDENSFVLNDDPEVESQLCDTRLLGSLFDGCDEPFQMGKRRLTDHWRKFIHPVAWRCKWLEIKLHELKSEALKYERELAEYDQSKQFEFEKVTFEGFDASSRALLPKIQRKEVMKRKKRKPVEQTPDVASYASHHNIFSYYESKKSVVSAYALDDNRTINGYDDIGFNDGWPSLHCRDGDDLSYQILQNIEVLRSRIHKLKTRMDSVVPCDILHNSGNHPYPEKGDRNSWQCTTSQHASECDMRDTFMPGNEVSSDGEEAPVPDFIRSLSQRLLEFSSEIIEDEILIPNPAAMEELCEFGIDLIQEAQKPHISLEKQKTVTLVQAHVDNLPINTSLQSIAHPPFSKSKQPDKKRTRGGPKSRLGRRSRRSSG